MHHQPDHLLAGAIKAAFEWFANQAGIGIPEWVPLPGTAQYLAAVERLDDVIYDIIRTRRRELENSSRQPQVTGIRGIERSCHCAQPEAQHGVLHAVRPRPVLPFRCQPVAEVNPRCSSGTQ